MSLSRYMNRGAHRARARAAGSRVAFVLSGGGVLGAVQVGQLEALIGAGIVPDMIVGASVGSLNAAAIAADPTLAGVERLREIWLSLRPEDIFPGSRMQRAWAFVSHSDHLYPNTGIRGLIKRCATRSFEQTQIPLSIVAANLRTGKEKWFSSGPLEPALLASTALPGVFPPVLVDGELYIDGGVVNNVPISRAIELGATKVYVLTCGSSVVSERIPTRPLDVLVQAFAHSRATRVDIDVARFSGMAQIEVLPTFDVGDVRFNDTSHSARLIRTAAEVTRQYLAASAPLRVVGA